VERPNAQEAIARIRDLPTLPAVLSKVLATAADPDASALDLGEHISADQSLSATLLKLVNSAYYGFQRQIKTVTQAIVILGFLEVRNLTLTATAFRTFKKGHPDFDRTQLWRHSLGTAMAADRTAKLLGMDVEGSFEAGLLHDIGKVVLDLLYPEGFRDAAHAAHERQLAIAVVEQEMFGIDHAQAGGLLGEHWNLPETVVEAIRFHHEPDNAIIDPKLTHLTAIANYLTYQAELGESSNGCPPEFPAESAKFLKFTEEQAIEVAEALAKNRQSIDVFLGQID
jgi:putative nucleotidyltransferase with HDIG domain